MDRLDEFGTGVERAVASALRVFGFRAAQAQSVVNENYFEGSSAMIDTPETKLQKKNERALSAPEKKEQEGLASHRPTEQDGPYEH